MKKLPIEAQVYFPVTCSVEPALIMVTVTNWRRNRSGRYSDFTEVGPIAYRLNLHEAIEIIVRTERSHGVVKPGNARSEVTVELTDKDVPPISGKSYYLAVALADRRARNMLPYLRGATIVASGVVDEHGSVTKIEGLEQKSQIVAEAIDHGRLKGTVYFFVPRLNVNMSPGEATWLKRLHDRGVIVNPVENIREIGVKSFSRWPPIVTCAIVSLSIVLSGVAVYYVSNIVDSGEAECSGEGTSCWSALPITVITQCKYYRHGYYTIWQDCETPSVVGVNDKYRFKVVSREPGYIYAWHKDLASKSLFDIVTDGTERYRKADVVEYIPPAGASFELGGSDSKEDYYFILTNKKISELQYLTGYQLFKSALHPIIDRLSEMRTIILGAPDHGNSAP